MFRPFVSVVIAFVGFSLLNISQAGQKIGLATLRTRRLPGSLIWAAATLGTSAAAFVNLYALSLGSVSLVGAMAGSGLASLALFSWLVMREPIRPRELAGIGVIFASAVVIGAFARTPPTEAPRTGLLYAILALACALYAALWVVFRRRGALAAAIIAGFSGTLGGFVTLMQKVSTTEHGRSRSLARGTQSSAVRLAPAGEILSNPFALGWIALSVLSMLVIQFAYRRGKAIQIIPAFSANYVVIPILGGMLVFGESLHPLQWAGVFSILAGVLLLVLRLPEDPDPSALPARPRRQR